MSLPSKKTVFLILLFLLPVIASAAYATYRHSAFVIGDGKDINLNGQVIGNGSMRDIVCIANCDYNASYELAVNKNNASGYAGLVNFQSPHTINKTASANIRNSHPDVATKYAAGGGSTPGWVLKNITFTNGFHGSLNASWEFNSSIGGQQANTLLKLNGTQITSTPTTTTTAMTFYSVNLTINTPPGSNLSLYGWKTSGGSIYVQNFNLSYDDAPIVTVEGVLS